MICTSLILTRWKWLLRKESSAKALLYPPGFIQVDDVVPGSRHEQ
jgi:hypothetical protein